MDHLAFISAYKNMKTWSAAWNSFSQSPKPPEFPPFYLRLLASHKFNPTQSTTIYYWDIVLNLLSKQPQPPHNAPAPVTKPQVHVWAAASIPMAHHRQGHRLIGHFFGDSCRLIGIDLFGTGASLGPLPIRRWRYPSGSCWSNCGFWSTCAQIGIVRTIFMPIPLSPTPHMQ